MKITFYFDHFGGMPFNAMICATTHPSRKSEGTKRYAFDVTIPDNELHDVDVVAPEVKVRAVTT